MVSEKLFVPASYNAETRIISSASPPNSFIKYSAVFFARFAGLEINASIFIFLFCKRLAILRASFLPLSFKGRSKSLRDRGAQRRGAGRRRKRILLPSPKEEGSEAGLFLFSSSSE